MKIFVLFISLLAFHSNVLAAPTYVKLEATINDIKDYTHERALRNYHIGDTVIYILSFDSNEDGYYIKNERTIPTTDLYANVNRYTDSIYFEYVCGDALERGYNEQEYFLGESKKYNSLEKTTISISSRLVINANELIENIKVNNTPISITELTRISSDPYQASKISAQGIITQISSLNLCET